MKGYRFDAPAHLAKFYDGATLDLSSDAYPTVTVNITHQEMICVMILTEIGPWGWGERIWTKPAPA